MFSDKLVKQDEVVLAFGHGDCNISVGDLERYVERLKNEPASTLADQYAHLKRLYDELDSMRKRLYSQVEFMKAVVIPEAFEREGITSFTTKDGYRVTATSRVFASCNSERKVDAYQWLKDNGFEDIVTETVNAGTLSSLAKGLLEGNDPDQTVYELPEELFNVTLRPQTSVTKVKQ